MEYEFKCDGLSVSYSMPSILGILYEVRKAGVPHVETTSARPSVRPSVCLRDSITG